MNGTGSSVGERKVREDRGEDGELNYQERVTVIWIEKFKLMGSCALDDIER